MNNELEIKFLLNREKADLLRREILSLPGIRDEGRMYEKMIMFDTPDRFLDKEDARLRVRQVSSQKESDDVKIEFSYKRRIKATGGIKKEEEIETNFHADFLNFYAILKKMNYYPISSYERFRETYWHDSLKITLDEFPFGYILEIEGGEKEIKEFCKILNLKSSQSYSLSCDDAYVDLCKEKKTEPKDHILFDDSEMPQYDFF
ncbi:MAG: CYTH domain-containing protein [Patescibacteria group bacterium]